MRQALSAVLLATTLAFSSACGGIEAKAPLSYTADAKRSYDAAMEEFNAHNWLEAQQAMREVKRKYGYSRYARLAELRIADADYEQEKFAEAVREYKAFVHDHRSDQGEVAYARSRIAEAQYKQITDSILLPAQEERDQAATIDAYKELRSFLHDYPEAKESVHVCILLEDVTVKLVRHELYVARFYGAHDNFDATVGRVQFALRNYTSEPCPASPAKTAAALEGVKLAPETETETSHIEFGMAPDALLLLGESYLKMHRWRDARAAFVAVLQRFPQSALIVQARGYLDFMQIQGV